MINNYVKPYGEVEMLIEYADGRKSEMMYRNAILNTGKSALAQAIAGDIGTSYNLYVCKMLFGTNGTISGVPKFVDASRNGLFGATLIAKNVTTIINPAAPTQVIFTSILTYSDAIGSSINEMALQLANNDLYSMVTFGEVTKTGSMQITYNWRVTFV